MCNELAFINVAVAPANPISFVGFQSSELDNEDGYDDEQNDQDDGYDDEKSGSGLTLSYDSAVAMLVGLFTLFVRLNLLLLCRRSTTQGSYVSITEEGRRDENVDSYGGLWSCTSPFPGGHLCLSVNMI
ncbi:hypothetical protein Dimus_021727 [Dionaea muscipula]